MAQAQQESVLVVGGSHSEIPLIRAAKRHGLRVITTGNRPDDLGHRHADAYEPSDYSNPDEVLAVAQRNRVSYVVSSCNDFAAITTAYVCDRLGLPGHDSHQTTLEIHHKNRFKALAARLGLSVPRSGEVHSQQEALSMALSIGYPVIVKPVDLTGGKGISVCADPRELAQAFASAIRLSRQPYVLVEEFVEGSRHGFTALLSGGKVGFFFADDEQYASNPFLVAGTTSLTSMPPSALEQVRRDLQILSDHLGLTDGLLHAQCILHNGQPRIIELCRRCPGDLYPTFVELSTGVDYANAILTAEMGCMQIEEVPHPAAYAILRRCLMADREGTIAGVALSDLATRVRVSDLLWWRPGDRIANHLVDKLGIVFLALQDAEELSQALAEGDSLARVAWVVS